MSESVKDDTGPVSQPENLIESGDPSANSRQFRGSLAQYATGVTIITTNAGGSLAGVTANSFSSLSLDPPLVLWSIARTSRSFDAFSSARHFAINVLGADQVGVSQHFSSKETDKFAGSAWHPGRNGVPLIDGAIATFECSVEAVHDGGDHVIIVGRVDHYAWYRGEPLVFAQGRYSIASEHPDYGKKEPAQATESLGPTDEPTLSLLFRVYHQMSAAFEVHRHAEKATHQQGRAMSALYSSPGIGVQDLMRITFMGQRDAEDAVADLKERGLVQENASRRLELTAAGVKTRLSIARRWAEFQAEMLDSIPAQDIDVVRRVLAKLADQKTPPA